MDPELARLWAELTARTDYERCARPRAARVSNEPAVRLLEALGRPQDGPLALHVAGSKGKGSTAAFLAAGLQAAGHRVGVYSSPHLSDWRERATIDGEFASDAAWIHSLSAVLAVSQGDETFFDLLTAAALHLFAAEGCTATVIEVGLGGRFDSTRVLRPAATLVTSIESEHEDVLGPGLEQIAWNKAGIYLAGCPAFAAAGIPEVALEVLRDEADAVGETLQIAPEVIGAGAALEPAHQRRNHALAATVLDALGLGAAFAQLDPGCTRMAGRFEERRLPDGRVVVLDTAHSENSLAAALELFRRRYHEQSRGVILALRDDKDPHALAAALRAQLGNRPQTERWWACPAGDHPRSADPVTLAAAFDAEVLASPALPEGPQALLVTGSTYLVGALRPQTLPDESATATTQDD